MKLTSTQIGTVALLVGVTVILIVIDVFLAGNHKDGDTISAIIIEASLRCGFLPYAFGCLMGHLFHRNTERGMPSWVPLAVMPAVGLLVWATLWAFEISGGFTPLIPLLLGIGAGVLFWENYGADGE